MPFNVFWKDKNSNYLGGNKNFLHDLQISSVEEIVGKKDNYLPCTKDQLRIIKETDAMILKGNEIINVQETRWYNDKEQIVLASKIPIINPSGEVLGILGVHQYLNIEQNINFLFDHSHLYVSDNRNKELSQSYTDLIRKQLDFVLTKREIICLSLWLKGISLKKCSLILQISDRTIETHRYNILKKLNLKNKQALITYLELKGLLKLMFLVTNSIIQ